MYEEGPLELSWSYTNNLKLSRLVFVGPIGDLLHIANSQFLKRS